MPFHDHFKVVVSGEGIFDNEGAVRAVQHLNTLAGLDTLESDEEKIRIESTSTIIYSLARHGCASAAAADKVRKHLDSGVLHKLAKKMVANYFNPISVNDYTCHGFVPVILGACAMSHGCQTLLDAPGYHMFFKTYHEFLRGIFEPSPMMDGAKMQMKKALYGPDAFKSGSAIDFTTFGGTTLRDNVKPYVNTGPHSMLGGVPTGYKPQFKPSTQAAISMVGPCSKEDMGYDDDHACGGCQKKLKKSMLCSRCKDQRYCSKECQRNDFRRHKAVCRTPEDAEAILNGHGTRWMNTYHMISGGGSGGLGGLGAMFGGMGMGMGM